MYVAAFLLALASAAVLPPAQGAANPDPADYRLGSYVGYKPCLHQEGTQCTAYDVLELVLVGDLTGDGRDDVFTIPSTTDLWVIPQKPDGSLDLVGRRVYRYGDNVNIPIEHFVLGDFNGDGALDVLGNDARWWRFMNLLLSDGAGAHTLQRVPVAGRFTTDWKYPFATDVDRDGHLDVVVYARADGAEGVGTYAYVQYGDGTGAFPRVRNFRLTDSGTTGVEMGDLDGDGLDDIAMCVTVGFPGEQLLAVAYHDGKAGYHEANVTPFSCPNTLTVADFDGDEQAEVTTWIAGNPYMQALSIPSPDDTSLVPMVAPYSIYPYTMLADDLNADGRIDLFTTQFMCKGACSWVFAAPYLNLADGWTGIAGPIPPDESSRTPANFGSGQRQYAAGDVNGDGCRDVVTANGHDGFAVYQGRHCLPPRRAARRDIDGDGASDIVWRHAGGRNFVWHSAQPRDQRRLRTVTDPDWMIVAIGDFDGDGAADLFWRHRVLGTNAVWPRGHPDGPRVPAARDTEWEVVGSGDFDGDGRDDLFWRNRRTGANAMWPGAQPAGQRPVAEVPNTQWQVAAVGDFNGDGIDDVLWRHATKGRLAIWWSGSHVGQSGAGVVGDPGWRIVGSGDLDQDRRDDLVWRHAGTGANVAWSAGNPAARLPIAGVRNVDWTIASVDDMTGDGVADLLWRHQGTGNLVLWRGGDYRDKRPATRVADLAWGIVP